MLTRRFLLIALVLLASEPLLAGEASDRATRVGFNADVRPILSNRCFKCHGFDAKARRGNLRLDLADVATAVRDDNTRAVSPGDPSASSLLERVRSSDPDVRMPPPSAGDPLSDREIAVLERWIAEGARWQKHWSFEAPVRAPLPEVSRPPVAVRAARHVHSRCA